MYFLMVGVFTAVLLLEDKEKFLFGKNIKKGASGVKQSEERGGQMLGGCESDRG